MTQMKRPLYDALVKFSKSKPISFHVPGHKNGLLFAEAGRTYFEEILKIDFTEITGLDDLHAPEGIIQEAENLAAQFFNVDESFFLIGGSTAGNLAMILATCKRGEPVLVARNCHKSIMNGLELAGAHPTFLSPEYDTKLKRYTHPSVETVKQAIAANPNARTLILTYPDYFGETYRIKEMIDYAHQFGIPVLVDEAHGVHFSIDERFPESAISLGADVVVHSVHKMAPAMTMGSMLHMNSKIVPKDRVAYYLQMLQSSSPSYPLMASLDMARYYLANIQKNDVTDALLYAKEIRELFQSLEAVDVLPVGKDSDPLKITLEVKEGYAMEDVVATFEKEGLFPELHTERHILLVLGLGRYLPLGKIKNVLQSVNQQLKISKNHATIEETMLFTHPLTSLALSYEEMETGKLKEISLASSVGYIAAEPVIPYPPGIPLILKGERIRQEHVELIEKLVNEGVTLQQRIADGRIRVFCE